jgi:hypothetical protein
LKDGIEESVKADTPLKENNYYLLLQFEKFWELYPLKKSQQKAKEDFLSLNPSPELCHQILTALQQQILFAQKLKQQGQWVAPWKFPANWLTQHCWNDELIMDEPQQEINNVPSKKHYTKQSAGDSLWDLCKAGLEPDEESNVIEFSGFRRSQTY